MHADFDPVSLRLFLAVCEEGSIVRASERESTVPSAVSKRISRLEEQVGIPLIQRGPGGMMPTEAGSAFALHAREVLATMHRMRLTMDNIASGGGGSVRILASLGALSHKLTSDLVRVLQRSRTIRVSLREAQSPQIVRAVREGSADLGVCWDAADLSDLATVAYRPDHACAIVGRNHPLARRRSVRFVEVLDYDYVSAMPGSMMEIMLTRHAAIAGKTLVAKIEIQSFSGVVQAVAAGLGYSILPREVVSATAGAQGIRMVPLSDSWALRQFVICSRSDPYISAAVRGIREGLRSEALAGS